MLVPPSDGLNKREPDPSPTKARGNAEMVVRVELPLFSKKGLNIDPL
jgi:hypothetical protein